MPTTHSTPAPEPFKPEWCTVKQACAHLSVGRATFYRYAKEGLIQLYTFGPDSKSKRVRIKDLDQLMCPVHTLSEPEQFARSGS